MAGNKLSLLAFIIILLCGIQIGLIFSTTDIVETKLTILQNICSIKTVLGTIPRTTLSLFAALMIALPLLGFVIGTLSAWFDLNRC